MAHKHHPKEARIRAVQQHDGGRPASQICKEMNISPATIKRWRDQLHLLAPPAALTMPKYAAITGRAFKPLDKYCTR